MMETLNARATLGQVCVLFSMLLCCQCGNRTDEKYSFYNDFENYREWGYAADRVSTENAHSGRYSCKTDAETNYGMGLTIPVGQLNRYKAKRIHFSAWLFSQVKDPDASLVVCVDRGSENLSYFQIELNQKIKNEKKWTFVEEEIVFPSKMPDDSEFKYFFWNRSGSAMYIDDMQLTISN